MSHASTPPSIRIYDSGVRHGRHSLPPRNSPGCSTAAVPMAIPRARPDSPPPPLPPPRYIAGLDAGIAPTSRHKTSRHDEPPAASAFGPLKSGLADLRDGLRDDPDGFDISSDRRYSSSALSHNLDPDLGADAEMSDEDQNTSRRASTASCRLHSESQLGQRSLDSSSNAYDKQLLAKIGGPSTGNSHPPRPAGSGTYLLPASQELPAARSARDRLGQLKPLSMPDRRKGSNDSASTRWTSASSSAASPSTTSFRSPFEAGADCPLRPVTSASGWEAGENTRKSKRTFDEQSVFMEPDFAMDSENGMRDLNLNERSPKGLDEYHLGTGAPLKRRAPSPPSESLRENRASGGNDLYHRRSAQMLNSRHSPPRTQMPHGSVSSASSAGQKTSSYISTASWNQSVASSATSYGDRPSPSGFSPSSEMDYVPMSPYATSRSLNPSPRSSVSKAPHQKPFADNDTSQNRKMSAEITSHSRHNSVTSKIQGLFICECCPKKPKKFDSAQELRAHEQEKQYQCQYCPNRFKNKNEAERHQNSLHLRRHSWSCAALAGVHAAFHPSGQSSSATDVCGFCGEEFANPPDWDARNEHLSHVHKYGECNQAKKFFRADHFRQHLKHSHAGASGKWTNVLETACMKEEPTPSVLPPPAQKDRPCPASSGGTTSASTMNSSTSNANTTAMIPGVIDEAHDES